MLQKTAFKIAAFISFFFIFSLASSYAIASTCSEWALGNTDLVGTAWTDQQLAKLCQGAEESMEPGTCIQFINAGKVNWGGGTKWAPSNALKLCKGTRNATTLLNCFEEKVSNGMRWEQATSSCQAAASASTAPPAPTASSAPTGEPTLPPGETFGVRGHSFQMGSATLYTARCSDCSGIYCQPGDEMIAHSAVCLNGTISNDVMDLSYDGPCSGVGCWMAGLLCRGSGGQILDRSSAHSRLQAYCRQK